MSFGYYTYNNVNRPYVGFRSAPAQEQTAKNNTAGGLPIITKPIETVENAINNTVDTFVKTSEEEEKKTSHKTAIAVGSSVLVLSGLVALLNPKFSGKMINKLKMMSHKAGTKAQKGGTKGKFYETMSKFWKGVGDIFQFTNTLNAGKDMGFKWLCTEKKTFGSVKNKTARNVLTKCDTGFRSVMSRVHNSITGWFDGISKRTVQGNYKKAYGKLDAFEELAKYDAFYAEQTEEKHIYLTFDVGYENGNTASILDTLKKHNVSATFFVVGTYIESDPELVKRMAEEGHIVGNHTWHHPDMSQIAAMDAFKKELEDVENAYLEVTGEEMTKFYRPPQGKYSEANLKMAQELEYKTFFWSLAYVDWYDDNQPTKEEAFDKLLGRIHPGAIVLLHSTSDTNALILDELIQKWEEMGYTIRPLTELS